MNGWVVGVIAIYVIMFIKYLRVNQKKEQRTFGRKEEGGRGGEAPHTQNPSSKVGEGG